LSFAGIGARRAGAEPNAPSDGFSALRTAHLNSVARLPGLAALALPPAAHAPRRASVFARRAISQ
jgi:hypothetical protein